MIHRAPLLLAVILLTVLAPVAAKVRELNDYGKLIRARDTEAITRIPKKILNDDELRKYLQQVSLKVEETLSPQSQEYSGLIIEGVRRTYPTAAAQANAANGCVVAGRLKEALLLMGKVCREDASNPDNLNNYAAFLIMGGGGNAAIPLLAKLNERFPDNSTVLNNLGQAWFGLGDLEEAKKHLDAAIRIFPRHPQANYTKSIIEGSKGNKGGAVAALKQSLQSTFSEDRANRLERLGGSLDFDADWGFRLPQDALGLDNIVIPPYPRSADALENAVEQWEAFRKACRQGADKLEAKGRKLDKELADQDTARQKRLQAAMSSMDPAGLAAIAREAKENSPPFIRKAMAKLVRLEEDGESRIRKLIAMSERLDETKTKTLSLRGDWQREREKFLELAQKKDLTYAQCVANATSLLGTYLPKINGLWEEYNTAYVDYLRKSTNSSAYFGQYTTPGGDVAVEALLTKLKRDYLMELAGLNVAFAEVDGDCSGFLEEEGGGDGGSAAKKKKKGAAGKLQDFYDLHCDHKYELKHLDMWSIEVTCNKMVSKLNLPFLKAERTDDLDANQLINATVMIGASTGLSKELGPVKAEVKAGGGLFIDIDSNGVTDAGPWGEIKAESGGTYGEGRDPYDIKVGGDRTISVGDLPSQTAVGAGLEARWGWNAGFSGKGGGLLNGLVF